jgi:hypothetical protein
MVAGGQISTKEFTSEKKESVLEALQKRFLRIVGRETAKVERLLLMEEQI